MLQVQGQFNSSDFFSVPQAQAFPTTETGSALGVSFAQMLASSVREGSEHGAETSFETNSQAETSPASSLTTNDEDEKPDIVEETIDGTLNVAVFSFESFKIEEFEPSLVEYEGEWAPLGAPAEVESEGGGPEFLQAVPFVPEYADAPPEGFEALTAAGGGGVFDGGVEASSLEGAERAAAEGRAVQGVTGEGARALAGAGGPGAAEGSAAAGEDAGASEAEIALAEGEGSAAKAERSGEGTEEAPLARGGDGAAAVRRQADGVEREGGEVGARDGRQSGKRDEGRRPASIRIERADRRSGGASNDASSGGTGEVVHASNNEGREIEIVVEVGGAAQSNAPLTSAKDAGQAAGGGSAEHSLAR
ncbi:MAG: hypothetical protein LBS82_05650, partial [Spirochaetaceae bacterium]|nr:hypothetical protein [Spirochaetaceae bacterium]